MLKNNYISIEGYKISSNKNIDEYIDLEKAEQKGLITKIFPLKNLKFFKFKQK